MTVSVFSYVWGTMLGKKVPAAAILFYFVYFVMRKEYRVKL